MNQVFTIYAKLPSLNEVTAANRYNKYAGASLKRDTEDLIIGWTRAARIKPVETYPVTVKITYYEPNKRRDVDNIESSQKFILDALQRAGIIKGDSPRYLPKAPIKEILYGGSVKQHSVRVEIIEAKK